MSFFGKRKKNPASPRVVAGNKLVCPVCGNLEFTERETLMNTAGMTFFNLDWANSPATNYICTKCTYVFWFMAPPNSHDHLPEKNDRVRKKLDDMNLT